jgi:hypothetical protein
VSAALVVGIATIDTESAALAANGVAKGVALTTASGSVGSISATIELKTAQFRANSAHPMVRASFRIRGELLHEPFCVCDLCLLVGQK